VRREVEVPKSKMLSLAILPRGRCNCFFQVPLHNGIGRVHWNINSLIRMLCRLILLRLVERLIPLEIDLQLDIVHWVAFSGRPNVLSRYSLISLYSLNLGGPL
jgi:hypothetical protein